MLNRMPNLVSSYTKGSHTIGVMNSLAKSERFGAWVIMITKFSRHALNANIVNVVILQNIAGNVRTGKTGPGGVLAVFTKASFGDAGCI